MSHGDSSRAEALVQLRRWAEAEAEILAQLARTPDDAHLHGLHAQCLFELGRQKEAISSARQGLAHSPDNGWLHYLSALALNELGNRRRALTEINEAIRCWPQWVESYNVRADIHIERARNYDSAGQMHHKAAARHRELARVDIETSLRLEPSSPQGHLVRARLALSINDRGGAAQAARAALTLDPNSPSAHGVLGLVAEQAGDRETAATHYLAAGRAAADPTVFTSRIRRLGKTEFASGLGVISAVGVALVRLGSEEGGKDWILIGGVVAVFIIVLAAATLLQRKQFQQMIPETARRVAALDAETRPRRRIRWK